MEAFLTEKDVFEGYIAEKQAQRNGPQPGDGSDIRFQLRTSRHYQNVYGSNDAAEKIYP